VPLAGDFWAVLPENLAREQSLIALKYSYFNALGFVQRTLYKVSLQ
jgi:hypothetical protein